MILIPLLLALLTAETHAKGAGSGQGSSSVIKIGSTYYMPLYKINDLQTAATISGARQLLQGGYSSGPSLGGYGGYPSQSPPTTPAPRKGYTYPPPTTRLPPLAETVPTSPPEEELPTRSPAAVSPDREAVLPTTPDPIGLEFEKDIESTGILAEPPRPVTDKPDFEISREYLPAYGMRIPGVAGRDYPNYGSVPKTSFTCSDFRYSGYFGDVEARCQSFHVCLRQSPTSGAQRWSFLCPNGTIFNQREFICSWWHDTSTPCSEAPSYFNLNQDLNWEDITERSMQRLMESQRVAPTSKLLQVQRSKTTTSAKSKSMTTGAIRKSESEAYEDNSLPASAFIVNRAPSKLNSGTSSNPPSKVLNPNGLTIPNLPPSALYGPPGHKAPEPTYLPPSPGVEIDQDAFDPETRDPEIPASRPEVSFETTTVKPIVKPKPKLNYLPPKPYLPPSKEPVPSVSFRAKDSETINTILSNSNIVDTLSDGARFQGFVNLGTSTQFFNSNIRDLLRGRRVQTVNPGYLELEKGVEADDPAKALLTSDESLGDRQSVEVSAFDQMALFVPKSDSPQTPTSIKAFPQVQSQAFPRVRPQAAPTSPKRFPQVMPSGFSDIGPRAQAQTSVQLKQAATTAQSYFQSIQGTPSSTQQTIVAQVQPQAATASRAQPYFVQVQSQPTPAPRPQPYFVQVQPQAAPPLAVQPQQQQYPRFIQPQQVPVQASLQPVTRVQEFLLTPTPRQEPAQNVRPLAQHPLLYSAPPQQPAQRYLLQQPAHQYLPQQPAQRYLPQQPAQQYLPQQPAQRYLPQQPAQQYLPEQFRAQSYVVPQAPVYAQGRGQNVQQPHPEPFIAPTDIPEIVPSITIHSSTIVTQERNSPALRNVQEQGGYQASASTKSVTVLKPSTQLSRNKFYVKYNAQFYTPQFTLTNYAKSRPTKLSLAAQKPQTQYYYNRSKAVENSLVNKSYYDGRSLLKNKDIPQWTDYVPSPSPSPQPAIHRNKTPNHNYRG